MKNSILLIPFFCVQLLIGQKKANGKIYIEHPAIEVVNQFNEAYISGDVEKIKELVSEDVKIRTLSDRKSRDINWLLGTSNYLSKNIENLDIKHYGGAYPDVMEYDQDNVLDVNTYEWMTGYDKNTGLDINMPRHATYRFNDKRDKIVWIWINDDQSLWDKNWEAYGTKENGVIYKDHPLVTKVRLLYQAYKTMDLDKIRSHYTENTRFYDVMNAEINEFNSLDEEMEQIKGLMNDFEIVNIRESGYPDALDYDGDGAVVISWADWTMKNKKSGKTATIKQHLQQWFNEDGEIVREDYYFNPAQLPE